MPAAHVTDRPMTRPLLSWVSIWALAVVMLAAHSDVSAQNAPSESAIREALEIELPESPAALIAVVGQSPILMGDLTPKIDARLKMVVEQQGRPLTEDEEKFGRVNMLRGLLRQAIQGKMLGESFLLSQVSTQDATKRAEVQRMMHGRARKLFYDSRVPQLLEKTETTDLTELDAKLRAEGASLQAQQREFIDSMLGQMYLNEMVNQKPTVSIFEIQTYYDQNSKEFEQKAAAKWEQLTVLFDRFPTREAAAAALAEMGNKALYGGNMQAVAKESSQEPFASSGGVHDWTQKGSLASTALEDQIFSLPINEMSQFIEDEVGLHIIKVTARREAGVQSIADVQEDIREILRRQKIAADEEKLVKEMEEKIPVWSIFPQDVEGARPLGKTKMAKKVSETLMQR